MYQLWLDDLFPKARFLDALSLVEKLGHKKTLQAMRMSWINESKVSSTTNNESPDKNPSFQQKNSETININHSEDILAVSQENVDVISDDLYGATPQPMSSRDPKSLSPSISILDHPASFSGIKSDEVPEDELDTLMAEEAEHSKSAQANAKMAYFTDKNKNLCFDDEEEAMAEMDLEW